MSSKTLKNNIQNEIVMALGGLLWHSAKAGVGKLLGEDEWADREFNEALDSMQKPAFSDTGEILEDMGETISDVFDSIFNRD